MRVTMVRVMTVMSGMSGVMVYIPRHVCAFGFFVVSTRAIALLVLSLQQTLPLNGTSAFSLFFYEGVFLVYSFSLSFSLSFSSFS